MLPSREELVQQYLEVSTVFQQLAIHRNFVCCLQKGRKTNLSYLVVQSDDNEFGQIRR
jgi:hypothetical protein